MHIYTPASFTKNFSWHLSYRRLHTAIGRGFGNDLKPTTRERWRSRSGVADQNQQLIPLNFFLYSCEGKAEDFVLADQLVEVAVTRPYNDDFAKLALFALHLACSGFWRNSKWADGRVAGWANDFIRSAWVGGSWQSAIFGERAIETFIETHLDAQPVTKRKVLTNYRYMLKSAGILEDDKFQELDLRQRWPVDAIQLFWDRQIFEGNLPPHSKEGLFEAALLNHEIYKLLSCDVGQLAAFSRAAYREYASKISGRDGQLSELRKSGRIAA